MDSPTALIRELDGKVDYLSDDRRTSALRHLTDLYLVSGEHLSGSEIQLIDDIFVRLVKAVEVSARALQATNLDDDTLIECARTKNQDHLLAILQRKTLSEAVTDVLMRHGDRDVMLSTAKIAGARLSVGSFGILIKRSDGDDVLVDCVGKRADLPPALFDKLLGAASERVRAKHKAEHPYAARQVDHAVSEMTERLSGGEVFLPPAPNTPLQEFVHSLNRAGELNLAKLAEFAKAGRINTLVAALALMAYVPDEAVADMVKAPGHEPLVILAKAIGLPWETTKIIFAACRSAYPLRLGELEKCASAFRRLDQKAARKILDFRCVNPQGKTLN